MQPANRVAVFVSNVSSRPIHLKAGRVISIALEADSSALPTIAAVHVGGRVISDNTSNLFGSCNGSVGTDNDSGIWMDDHFSASC